LGEGKSPPPIFGAAAPGNLRYDDPLATVKGNYPFLGMVRGANAADQAKMAANTLARVARANAKVRRAEQALERAREEFRNAVVAAHEAGETLAAIARTVGVTRQRIKQIVGN
jgi:DNA-directed RNA polymerase specialized sigma24 family protein